MDEATPLIQITGMTQNGKSTLKRQLVMRRDRVLEVAPFPIATPGYPLEQFMSVREAVAAYMKNPVKTFRMAVVVQTPQEFKEACWFAWTLAPCTFVMDETRLYLPSAAEVPLEFNYAAQAWAHAGDHVGEKRHVQMIAVGQRPVNLPPIFRSEVSVWYLFRMNTKADRKLLGDDFGIPSEISEKAGKLAPFHYMRVDRFGDISYGQTLG